MQYLHTDPLLAEARNYILNFVTLAHPDWLQIEGLSADMVQLPARYHQDLTSHLLKVHQIDITLFSQINLGQWRTDQPENMQLALNLLRFLQLPSSLFDRAIYLVSICLIAPLFFKEIIKDRLNRIHIHLANELGLLISEIPLLLAQLKTHCALGFNLANDIDYLDQLDIWLRGLGQAYILKTATPCPVIHKLLKTKFKMLDDTISMPTYTPLPVALDLDFIIKMARQA